MKNKFLFSAVLVLFLNCNLHGQNTECTTIPLSYNGAVFTTAVPASFGDSIITFNITNNHPSQGGLLIHWQSLSHSHLYLPE
jgi:hypothetical protein